MFKEVLTFRIDNHSLHLQKRKSQNNGHSSKSHYTNLFDDGADDLVNGQNFVCMLQWEKEKMNVSGWYQSI
jgi:hypothetical protein